MKKLNLAIVGLGEGRSIIAAARSSPHWNIRWLCNLNATLLEGLRTVTVSAAMNQSLLEQKPMAVAEVTKSHGQPIPLEQIIYV